MSVVYCNMHSKANGENCNAPYSIDISKDDKALQRMHDDVDAQLDKLFA